MQLYRSIDLLHEIPILTISKRRTIEVYPFSNHFHNLLFIIGHQPSVSQASPKYSRLTYTMITAALEDGYR